MPKAGILLQHFKTITNPGENYSEKKAEKLRNTWRKDFSVEMRQELPKKWGFCSV